MAVKPAVEWGQFHSIALLPMLLRTISLLIIALMSFIVLAAARADAQTGDTQNFFPKDTKATIQAVTDELNSNDPAQIDQAIGQIEFWISGGHVPKDLGRSWLGAMIKDQRYQDAADAALNGSLAQPNIGNISLCMPWRIKALLAMGKSQEALQAAKSYYNVCYMKNTNDAINLVAQCLVVCHPENTEIVREFRIEQSGAGANNADSGTQPAPMLQSVTVDAASYNDAINKWNAKSTVSGKFYDYFPYANLLLLADRGQDAQKVFTQLYQLATTQDELNDAAEGIARSMRAEDGTVFRANAWLLSLQKQK
jgi:hypothetical protein